MQAKTAESSSEAKAGFSSTGEATGAAPKEASSISKPAAASTPAPQTIIHGTPTPATAPKTPTTHSLEGAKNDLAKLMQAGAATQSDVASITSILKDHAALKEKVDKLKSLLGRSAKAQREAKVDLEATQKRLNQALREIDRLNQKLDKLQSRPTHSKSTICKRSSVDVSFPCNSISNVSFSGFAHGF